MELINKGLLKFDSFLPMYNWIYPVSDCPAEGIDPGNPQEVFKRLDTSIVKSRAFYFHIPFCKSICTFCNFQRSLVKDEKDVETYVNALAKEIELKAEYDAIKNIPVAAIFFGGGSPSILSPDQIKRIGAAIKKNYDLSKLSEFSVELSLSTITPEKLEAFRDIGATHARFGVQTFNPKYRAMFNLSPNTEPVYDAAKTLPQYFPYTSFDMMYGFNGQTDEEFVSDIRQAIGLGVKNIDYYPINNVVTQTSLHQAYEGAGLAPTTGFRKFLMNVLLREFMEAGGYLPHNGHGYVKVSDDEIRRSPVVTDKYDFQYHEHVYGYSDTEVIGFGSNAISSLNSYTIRNALSWESYADAMNNNKWNFRVWEHDPLLDTSKGLIEHLPYHGVVDKKRIDQDLVHPETSKALGELVAAGLLIETPETFELTRSGWYWYINIMYYLCPKSERQILDGFISKARNDSVRNIESCEMPTG